MIAVPTVATPAVTTNPPVLTLTPLPAVTIPIESISTTSLLKIDPATEICPSKYATVSVVVPLPTYKLYSDLAVVAIPTLLPV